MTLPFNSETRTGAFEFFVYHTVYEVCKFMEVQESKLASFGAVHPFIQSGIDATPQKTLSHDRLRRLTRKRESMSSHSGGRGEKKRGHRTNKEVDRYISPTSQAELIAEKLV
jgi:hypothetical protein